MSSSAAEFLLINNNNTRTKFALGSGVDLLAHESIASTEVAEGTVRALLARWDYEKVVLASVVPAHVPALRKAQDSRPIVEVSHEIDLGIAVDFPDPSKVGADRLANAAAVAGRYPGEPVVVVDFGTAVTFDIVDSRPAYVGGVIAPGLDAMKRYLHKKTALLPEIELARPPSAIGKTTEHAMQSGAFHGYRGLVREILRQVEAELGCPAKVIATGGYAALIAEDLPEIALLEPNLTMQGLLRIGRLNF
ncbi:MAG: type III pantothenate kinase [Verrucomicrobiales bacterium]